MLELSFSARITLVIAVCLAVLVWQAVLASFGQQPSTALISGATSIILATVVLGVKNGNGTKNGTNENRERK